MASTVIASGAADDDFRLLRAGEVAKIIAVSTRTLWRLVSTGKFPQPVRIGGNTRWRAGDVYRWIQNGCT